MKTRKNLPMISHAILFVLLALLSTGCGGGPSKDVIQEAALQNVRVSLTIRSIDRIKITNNYTRKIGDETIYFYDVEGTGKR